MKEDIIMKNRKYLRELEEQIGVQYPFNMNKMCIFGTKVSDPQLMFFDGEETYQFLVEVKRKSEKLDVIPVWLQKNAYTIGIPYVPNGTEIMILGEYRSANWTDEDGKRHLEMYLKSVDYYVGNVHRDDEFDNNIVLLEGYICTKPTLKHTFKGRTICDFMVAINDGINEPEYFPIIAWGSKAKEVFTCYNVGDKLTILGRVQSREYHKGDQAFIAYEISSRYIKRHVKERERKITYPFQNRHQYENMEKSAV